MLVKGFRFGMLLQLAIGPVCVFIFQLAIGSGFFVAGIAILGVVLVDGLFIVAAILGIARFIEKDNVKNLLKVIGAIILFIFGLSMVMGVFYINLIPSLDFLMSVKSGHSFLQAIILTASNPLTILFWAGVFSTKLIEEKMSQKEIYLYGAGALLSTLISLTFIAIIGSFTNAFLPTMLIQILNGVVGAILIYFSIKMILKK